MSGVRGSHTSRYTFIVSRIQEPLRSSQKWKREERPICGKVPFPPYSSCPFTHSTMKPQPQRDKSTSYQDYFAEMPPAEMIQSAIAV